MKALIAGLFLMLSASAFASQHHMIDTLGSSGKGQFVAIEEYGYNPTERQFYVKIQIMNAWKNEYVSKPIEIKLPAQNQLTLEEARARARRLAQDDLVKFNIQS
jgi:predicted secreted protein